MSNLKEPESKPSERTARHPKLAKTAMPKFNSFRSWRIWQRVLVILVAVVLLCTGTMYGIALWYQHSQAGKPYQLGVSFIPSYASYLGVDPHETLAAIINDLGVRQFRFVSYWNEIEPEQGTYDFSTLDWQMQAAEKSGSKVSLSIGLRQPRWPECHAPDWVDTSKPASTWQPQLEAYMTKVIERYKHSPSLTSYQLENEFFNSFGQCQNFDRARLSAELALVKRLDPRHPVIISRSDNYAGFAVRKPHGDINGISLYRRVWDGTLTKHYQTYPFPSWYYAFLAGAQKLLTGQPSVIHELQAEPWPPRGQTMLGTSLSEQNKTFDAAQLQRTVSFAKQTGIRHIDLWGAEYWYYRMQVLHDPSVWDEAKTIFAQQ